MIKFGFFLICSFLAVITVYAQDYRSLSGHEDAVYSITYSPDGNYLASGSADKTIKIWDVASGKCILTIPSDSGTVYTVAYSPDGKILASGGYDGSVKFWDLSTGKCMRTMVGHKTSVTSIVFFPDGKRIVSGSTDTTVKVWDVVTGTCLHTLTGHRYNVNGVAVSPDGSKMLSASYDNTIKIWDATSYACLATLNDHLNSVLCAAFSPDGKYIVSGSSDTTIKLWDASTLSCLETMTLQRFDVKAVLFSPDGKYFASGGCDFTVRICATHSRRVVMTMPRYEDTVSSLAYSPDRNYIASGNFDKIIRIRSCTLKGQIRDHVQGKLNGWLKKGEFEKTADYNKRISPPVREAKIKEFTAEVLRVIKTEFLKTVGPGSMNLQSYDADNESFLIVLANGQSISMNVPAKDAKSFKEQWEKISIEASDAAIIGDAFEVTKLVMKNHALRKTYTYDSKSPAPYTALDIQYSYDDITVDVPSANQNNGTVITTGTMTVGRSDIDIDIPKTRMNNPDAIAVIIGNKDYTKTKPVDFAINDVQAMKKYLIDVFGYKEGNILVIQNAGKGDFETLFGTDGNPKGKLYNLIKSKKSDVFIYYVGHGAPGVNTKKGYFVPVECDPQYVELGGYPIDTFYANCASLQTRSMTIVLDACFSGTDLLKNMSPMVIEADNPAIGIDNAVVFASSSGSQVSTWYNEKGHSLFTYYFLKAIHGKNADTNKDGKLTIQELYLYLSDETNGIPYQARRLHGVEQMPTVESKDMSKVMVTY